MSYCPTCGRQRTSEARYCRGCGRDFGVAVMAANSAPASAMPPAETAVESPRSDPPTEEPPTVTVTAGAAAGALVGPADASPAVLVDVGPAAVGPARRAADPRARGPRARAVDPHRGYRADRSWRRHVRAGEEPQRAGVGGSGRQHAHADGGSHHAPGPACHHAARKPAAVRFPVRVGLPVRVALAVGVAERGQHRSGGDECPARGGGGAKPLLPGDQPARLRGVRKLADREGQG